jgi:hypothetical protein
MNLCRHMLHHSRTSQLPTVSSANMTVRKCHLRCRVVGSHMFDRYTQSLPSVSTLKGTSLNCVILHFNTQIQVTEAEKYRKLNRFEHSCNYGNSVSEHPVAYIKSNIENRRYATIYIILKQYLLFHNMFRTYLAIIRCI